MRAVIQALRVVVNIHVCGMADICKQADVGPEM